MRTYLITYDLQHSHTAVKQHLLKKGFYEAIRLPDGTTLELPNTTLLVEADSAKAAGELFLKETRAATLSIGSNVQRYLVTASTADCSGG
ncbi:hypothetical protein [Myxococcus xanthus]|uniref:hypothetical protein n=1 Tax=Myxococcus xanthus TaxID=34 RepID=UPI00148C00D4|nr:hypothetical protein [Myxococcus xanthus]NOJ91004.1 hypothetical protein [Myxococcus xanthus]